jgi:hypothetical protein
MNDRTTYQKCPNCHQRKLETISSHEWFLANKGKVESHEHNKCVNCGFEEDECLQQKKKIILAGIFGTDRESLIEETQCDRLEKETGVQIGRIYHYFEKRQWQKTISTIEEFCTNESNFQITVDKEPTLRTLKACCYYFSGQTRASQKESENFSPVFSTDERDAEFVNNILRLLSNQENANDEYEAFKQRWFCSFTAPLIILTPADLLADCLASLITDNVSDSSRFLDDFVTNTILGHIFLVEGPFQNGTIPLLFELVKSQVEWDRWPNDEIQFWEQITKSTIPTDENNNSNSHWFREIKRNTNLLAFDILLAQERMDEAFRYIETVGVDYIRAVEEEQSCEDNDWLALPSESYPLQLDPDEWLSDKDLHTAAYQCEYSEIWAEVRKYLTIIDFYAKQLDKKHLSREYSILVEDRILRVTEEYESDEWLKEKHLNYRFPPIVAKIYSSRKDWKSARKYIEKSNIPEPERIDWLLKLDLLGRLFFALADLDSRKQQQVLAFVKLIIQLEPALRNCIRKTLNHKRVDWREKVRKSFHVDKRIEQHSSDYNLPSEPELDELDWLTFPEMIDVIIYQFWESFRESMGSKEDWIAIKKEITPIRNTIAHARPLTETQCNYVIEKAETIFQKLQTLL